MGETPDTRTLAFQIVCNDPELLRERYGAALERKILSEIAIDVWGSLRWLVLNGKRSGTRIDIEFPADRQQDHVRQLISTLGGHGWTARLVPDRNTKVVDYVNDKKRMAGARSASLGQS
jgi:hypothetical protein